MHDHISVFHKTSIVAHIAIPTQAVEANICSLESQFSEATAKKEALSQQVADCTVKLSRAEKLIGGLGGEKSRWQATVEQLAQVRLSYPLLICDHQLNC